jgi:hypothetical protein
VQCNNDEDINEEILQASSLDLDNFGKTGLIYASPGKVTTTSSTFNNWITSTNGGIMYFGSGSVYNDTDSTFTMNAAYNGGAIYFVGTQISLTSTTFNKNYAANGGALVFDNNSKTNTYESVTISNNFARFRGGGILVIGLAKLALTSGIFTGNLWPKSGSAIYALGAGDSTIDNIEFSENKAWEGNTLWFLFSNVELTSITVKNNIVYAETTGIFINFSKFVINYSTFTTDTFPENATDIQEAASDAFNSGWFISISPGSDVEITNSQFSNGYSTNGGFIYLSGNSKLFIAGSNFTNRAANSEGGAIYASTFKDIKITDCKFSNNIAETNGWDLYLSTGTTQITDSTFTINPQPSSIYISQGNFTGTGITITNVETGNTKTPVNVYGGGIYGSNINKFVLQASTFTDIDFSYIGGAVYLTQTESYKR